MQDVEVLYIAGWGRSGSTILDTVLGQIDGFTSVGEVKYLWERSLVEKRRCGCGEPFESCSFWTEVIDEAFGGLPDPGHVRAMQRAANGFRTRQLPLFLSSSTTERYIDRFQTYMEETRRLYVAILNVSGSRIIVDSSKSPSYLTLLGQIPGFRVRTVHLVRDPRAVAHSWTRYKLDPDQPSGKPMPQFHPAVTGAYWTAWNAAIERVGRRQDGYLRVRYEDLTASPTRLLREIVDFAGFTDSKLPLVDDRTVTMGASHTVSGNPIRLQTGDISIRQDAAWVDEMSPSNQRWALMTSSPLRRRYGYP